MSDSPTENQSAPAKSALRFFRAGGFDQVRLENASDLAALPSLDQKLWVALSCPTRGLNIDPRSLDFIDSDKDGRVRASELLNAVKWASDRLKAPEALLQGGPLPLAAIDDGKPEGAALLASAREILKNIDKADAADITVEDAADTEKVFVGTRFNGDGIIPPSASDDPTLQSVITDIIASLGSIPDLGGEAGISQEIADIFFDEAETYAAWREQSDRLGISPLGNGTVDGAETLVAVSAKIDDYFLRCQLAAYDSRAKGVLNRSPEDYAAIGARQLTTDDADLLSFPIALIAADRPLPLMHGVNPAWSEPMARFRNQVIIPLLGERDTLSLEEWTDLKARFAAYAAWRNERSNPPAASLAVEALGIERIRAILTSGARQAVNDLIAQDKAMASRFEAIAEVERLTRYHRDIGRLLNNFVSFRDFYTGRDKAIFQLGTLYLDGRSCDLCLRVEDVAKHATMANLSGIYLAYCQCTRQNSSETMNIVAAFTAGDSDRLIVGRNGVFYDRLGNDWDATIVKILDHPISIQQAFWSPYRRVGRMIGEQIEKIATAKSKEIQEKTAAAVAAPGKEAAAVAPPHPGAAPATPAATAASPPPPPAFDVGRFAGIFAALGLALGAIGTAIASVVTGLLHLPLWEVPLAIGGLLLAISGPSMVIAYLKLRQRNLGPLLDGNGWAVNAQAKINIPFGATLTATAKLPDGAERSLSDPYAERKRPWKLYIALAITAIMVAAVLQETHLVSSVVHLLNKPATSIDAPAAPTATPAAKTP